MKTKLEKWVKNTKKYLDDGCAFVLCNQKYFKFDIDKCRELMKKEGIEIKEYYDNSEKGKVYMFFYPSLFTEEEFNKMLELQKK